MKKLFLLTAILGLMAFTPVNKTRNKVLVLSLTKGYHHASIADGIVFLQKLGSENKFDVDTTTDAANFTDDNLKQYQALIFLSPTGNALFNDGQKQAFQNFIHRGGGFVGIHAATDCLYDWDWYGKLVGAYFTKHPKIQPGKVSVSDANNISTKMLPAIWTHTDEWYNFRDMNPDIKILLTVDENSYVGFGTNSKHPVSWYHEFEGGRVFYTSLGHTTEDYTTDTLFSQHVLGGIKYALGLKK
jgi:type 1 glutamine amidotransferase